ncbi:type II toxin-antitoxin system RelE/ParE family toxin [Endozoicomonas sp. ALC020]|uniref:type II toxin-antitoxin system RelE/ParE family toxin n=1 Tax=unclassified Endozoicomonas TaxID=2644528 RepID=UPI003BB03B28
MVIIETAVFTRRIKELMSDEEYKLLQESLVNRPDAGAIIQASGGLRKLRWKLEGRGKSGGVRIIYYWVTADDQIYMLYAYPKNEQEELTADQKKMLKKMVERWSDG